MNGLRPTKSDSFCSRLAGAIFPGAALSALLLAAALSAIPSVLRADPPEPSTQGFVTLPEAESVVTDDWGPLPREIRWAKDNAEMVLIPAGEFIMGSDSKTQAERNETPSRKIYLNSYYIDKYEVTNSQYAAFAKDTGRIMPRITRRQLGLGEPDRPVVALNYEDASTYARWTGKLLASEAQWEKAARGPKGNLYPWGNDWKPTNANTKEGGRGTTAKGGSYPADKSFYGVFDLAGNVSEWVLDWYDRDSYKHMDQRNPLNNKVGSNSRVVRGGDFYYDKENARAANRRYRPPLETHEEVGFRTVKLVDPKPTPTPARTPEDLTTPTPTPDPITSIEPQLFEAWSTTGSKPAKAVNPVNSGTKSVITVVNRLPVDIAVSCVNTEPAIIIFDRQIPAMAAVDLDLVTDQDMVLYVKLKDGSGRIVRTRPRFRSNSRPILAIETSQFLSTIEKPGAVSKPAAETPTLRIYYQMPQFAWNRVSFYNSTDTTVTLTFPKCPLYDTTGVTAPMAQYPVDLGPNICWDGALALGPHEATLTYLRTFDAMAQPIRFTIDPSRDARGVFITTNTSTNDRVKVFTRSLAPLKSELREGTLKGARR